MVRMHWKPSDGDHYRMYFHCQTNLVATFRELYPTELRYLVTDWGGSMGKWGGVLSREKWDCRGFTGQTRDFVKDVRNGEVRFGYSGQHTGTFVKGIAPADVKWLLGYLGRITDAQLNAALNASGALPEDVSCFTAALRDRINQLRRVAQ